MKDLLAEPVKPKNGDLLKADGPKNLSKLFSDYYRMLSIMLKQKE
jgi:hypothetical protein